MWFWHTRRVLASTSLARTDTVFFVLSTWPVLSNWSITSFFLCFLIINLLFPPLSSPVIPWCSRVEDVRRCVRGRGQRCPADPAVILASCHGGDQEPDCGTLSLKHTDKHILAKLSLRFNGFIWFPTHANTKAQLYCALVSISHWPPIPYFQKDFRVQELPLARIKKIMKLDEDVKVRGQHKWLTILRK